MPAAPSGTLGPEMRTSPTPPRPGGVAAATMVSVRVMLAGVPRLPPETLGKEALRACAARAARRTQAGQVLFAAMAASMRRLVFHCWGIARMVVVTQHSH